MTRTRSATRPLLRYTAVLAAGLALLLLSGCKLAEVFSLSGPQSTMVTAGPVAKTQWDLFMVTVYVTTFIFVITGAVLAYAQIKFRAKSEADEHAEVPAEAGHGNPFVEIGLIAGSVALLVIIAIPTVQGIWYTHDVPEAEKGSAIEINATGYQWWFKFEYPSEMVAQPFGGEAPLVTGNELVVPAGTPVRVNLRTIDVIHSFWIPKLAGKVDMMPNRANHLWFKADKPGYFYGQCAEYCGESHAIMKFRVIALSLSDYVKWVENQKQAARTVTAQSLAAATVNEQPKASFAGLSSTSPGSTFGSSPQFDTDPFAGWQAKQRLDAGEDAGLIATGRKLFADKTCITCHTVRGHEGIGITGPDLTHVGARTSIAAGVLENSAERLHQWIKDPEFFKPGNKMYHGGYIDVQTKQPKFTLTDTEIDALVAYLHSLK
ncbi:Cytochrome c oxidase subunit 2 precursor [Lacunisphaera limnophila]|uniref:cytochrome-c oxidase n=1 Tax=Lacunisphaera limnophila TaxID=1838286 RepID=A0A1I7PHG7_9BACT|nr:cytochrome c oxidase subunit II [Lacunisphaera limnophila]AOS43048.1 Cytochrome c oxidase subunit 2 precursor [Lacunisphaera limnophila]